QDQAVEQANAALSTFVERFNLSHLDGLRRKVGLSTQQDGDLALAQDLLDRMAAGKADFTLTFRRLCEAAMDAERDADVRILFENPASYDDWAGRWRRRLEAEPGGGASRRAAMRSVNPAFIPRNHRVEAVIQAAVNDDYAPFEELLTVLSKPFDDQPAYTAYADPPLPEQRVLQTFCGT
ncbi:MAG: protein adenylyltransferase SelO family protein, partial [Bradyrhizobium sp.]